MPTLYFSSELHSYQNRPLAYCSAVPGHESDLSNRGPLYVAGYEPHIALLRAGGGRAFHGLSIYAS